MKPKIIAKIESEETASKLAVLIDADNAQPATFEYLLQEIAKYGEATVKRIYGDFTSPQNAQWRKILNEFAIKPMHQFNYTVGKNATDSTLIIDAMDLLYTRRFDGFCLVSSDSDFTGIATRIREEGLMVYGFGRKTTPDSFKKACHKFIETEILIPTPSPEEKSNPQKTTDSEQHHEKSIKNTVKKLPVDFILKALEESVDESGWAQIGTFGSYLNKLRPDFDSRQFGYKKLSDLIRAANDIFTIEERKQANSDAKTLYLKAKKRKNKKSNKSI
jgi:uncharacterized LabA/DUF88 family protein